MAGGRSGDRLPRQVNGDEGAEGVGVGSSGLLPLKGAGELADVIDM